MFQTFRTLGRTFQNHLRPFNSSYWVAVKELNVDDHTMDSGSVVNQLGSGL